MKISEPPFGWREVWHQGFAPILPLDGLKALAEALRTDDPRLTQGSTTTPPPLMCVEDWPCQAGCLLGYIGAASNGGFCCSREEWQPTSPPHTNKDAASVGIVEEFFARACFDADQRLGEPAACRSLLNAFDDMPRDQMRREFLVEVEAELARREREENRVNGVDSAKAEG